MDIKNALAVCLISFFSATLVVLLARALDLQAAGQVESQLEAIVEELRAIRKQGGIATGESQPTEDCVMVYYFHGEKCPDCVSAESQAHEAVRSAFGPELESGEVVWKVLDHRKDKLAEKLGIANTVVVVARMKDGQVEDPREFLVLGLVRDKGAIAKRIRDNVNEMLETSNELHAPDSNGDLPDIPIPEVDPSEIPVPGVPDDIPVPQ